MSAIQESLQFWLHKVSNEQASLSDMVGVCSKDSLLLHFLTSYLSAVNILESYPMKDKIGESSAKRSEAALSLSRASSTILTRKAFDLQRFCFGCAVWLI